MIEKEIASQVLAIGCAYDPPRGGVAQVMYTYSKEVYPRFRCIINSAEGGLIRKMWLMTVALVKTFSVLVTDRHVRIVHIHTASYRSFYRSAWFVKLAGAMGRKVVLHIHGGGFREFYQSNPKRIGHTLRKADCVIALSKSWMSYYSEELGLPQVVTVPNVIPNPQIEAVDDDGKLHLLFLGFIIEQKGIFDLLEVIKVHREEFEGRLLLHVGGSHEVDRLKKFVADNDLEKLVQYEGWVSGKKKTALLNMMDAYILPSYVEGLPISILEALSYGKPVITTPVGGIPEVVNEENGWLIAPGDRKSMGETIASLLASPQTVKEKGNKAKQAIMGNTPSNVSEILNSVYQNLLK